MKAGIGKKKERSNMLTDPVPAKDSPSAVKSMWNKMRPLVSMIRIDRAAALPESMACSKDIVLMYAAISLLMSTVNLESVFLKISEE